MGQFLNKLADHIEMTGPIRVGIVDDSPTFIGLIGAAFKSDPTFEIAGSAQDSIEAKKLIEKEKPDILTLDIALPGQNGLDLLVDVMKTTPMPVIMVSSLTKNGAEISVEALRRGAVACVLKPRGTDQILLFHQELRLQAAAVKKNVHKTHSNYKRRKLTKTHPQKKVAVIALAASTGGLKSIDFILRALPSQAPPIVITQHLQPAFLEKLASRLNDEHEFNVGLALEQETLSHGDVRFAPPHRHLSLFSSFHGIKCKLEPGSDDEIIRPAADIMFNSIAKEIGRDSVGIVLSGMGKDGANGLLAMKNKGAYCVGESEETCTVYGMPKQAKKLGAIDIEKPIGILGNHVAEICGFTRL